MFVYLPTSSAGRLQISALSAAKVAPRSFPIAPIDHQMNLNPSKCCVITHRRKQTSNHRAFANILGRLRIAQRITKNISNSTEKIYTNINVSRRANVTSQMFRSADFVKKINKQFMVVLPFALFSYVLGIMLSGDTPNYISQRKCFKSSLEIEI